MSRSVAVLKGGTSAERDVSLVSGAACAKALRDAGYDAYEVEVTQDIAALLEALTPAPDVVFNALHGRWGEDGCIQGLLELLHIPYTCCISPTPTRASWPRRWPCTRRWRKASPRPPA
jgi:D-alanine-D-alanine ligase